MNERRIELKLGGTESFQAGVRTAQWPVETVYIAPDEVVTVLDGERDRGGAPPRQMSGIRSTNRVMAPARPA